MLKNILISLLLTSCVCGCASTNKEFRPIENSAIVKTFDKETDVYLQKKEFARWFLQTYCRIENPQDYTCSGFDEINHDDFLTVDSSFIIGAALYQFDENPIKNTSKHIYRFTNASVISSRDGSVCRVEYNAAKTKGKIVLKDVDKHDRTRYNIYREELSEEQIKRFEESFDPESFCNVDFKCRQVADGGGYDCIEYAHEDEYHVAIKHCQDEIETYYGAAYDLCVEVFDDLDDLDYGFLKPRDYYNR